MQNYNAGLGQVFTRIVNVNIQYDKTGLGTVTYQQGRAVISADGAINMTDDQLITRKFLFDSSADAPVPIFDIVTGEIVPDQFTTAKKSMLAVYAHLHAHQLLSDAEEAAAALLAQVPVEAS